MSLRVKMDAGKLVPVGPLPPWWVEGGEIEIESNSDNGSVPPLDTSGSDGLSDEEARSLQARLDEMRKLSKDYMRKVMGLAE